jgi:hypothetical protein
LKHFSKFFYLSENWFFFKLLQQDRSYDTILPIIFLMLLYIDRYLKYNSRGFTWICPLAYNQILAQNTLRSAIQAIDYGFNHFYYNVDPFHIQYHFLMLNIFQ